MAKASLQPAVTETKTVEVKPATVTLELTLAEAETLRYLTGSITGSSSKSRRSHTNAVYYALRAAGVSHEHVSASVEPRAYSGLGFHFKEEPGFNRALSFSKGGDTPTV